jgi:putative membrane protein
MSNRLSQYGIVAVLAAGAILGACNSKSNTMARTDTTAANGQPANATGTGLDTTAAGGTVSNTNTSDDWSNPSYTLGFLNAANAGEIAEAKLAQQRATNPAVKQFAQQMITDHSAMDQQGQKVAKQLNVTPSDSAGPAKDLAKGSKDEMKDLSNKKMGKDWDEDYIEKQIDDHQKVLDKLNDIAKSNAAPEIKNLVQSAIPKVQSHLDLAKNIKDTKLKS